MINSQYSQYIIVCTTHDMCIRPACVHLKLHTILCPCGPICVRRSSTRWWPWHADWHTMTSQLLLNISATSAGSDSSGASSSAPPSGSQAAHPPVVCPWIGEHILQARGFMWWCGLSLNCLYLTDCYTWLGIYFFLPFFFFYFTFLLHQFTHFEVSPDIIMPFLCSLLMTCVASICWIFCC